MKWIFGQWNKSVNIHFDAITARDIIANYRKNANNESEESKNNNKDIEDTPQEMGNAVAFWCTNRFAWKEKVLTEFYNTGKWISDGTEAKEYPSFVFFFCKPQM